METGNEVEWSVLGGDIDVTIIGQVEKISDTHATVREAHAFSIWGGSNACRGTLHEVPLDELRPASSSGKRIVRETLTKWRAKHLTMPMVD